MAADDAFPILTPAPIIGCGAMAFNVTDALLPLGSFASSLSMEQAAAALQPLILFVIGMAIYSVFIFKFYRFLARRDMFTLQMEDHEHKRLAVLAHWLKNLVAFPVAVFFWFMVLSLLMVMISRVPDLGQIFQISIALVSAVRIAAYYNEDLSRDLAKMLPFALLGIFILNIYDVAFTSSLNMFYTLPLYLDTIAYYLAFVIVLEAVLRLLLHTKYWIFGRPLEKPKPPGCRGRG